MAVKLRLTRTGRKNFPFFRIGAYDSRTQRDGKALEYLGYYDPRMITKERLKMDIDRVKYWLSIGAEPSETIASFLRENKIPYKKNAKRTARNKARSKKRALKRKEKRRSAAGNAKP
jgi:small subunit ribosomal protein S16